MVQYSICMCYSIQELNNLSVGGYIQLTKCDEVMDRRRYATIVWRERSCLLA